MSNSFTVEEMDPTAKDKLTALLERIKDDYDSKLRKGRTTTEAECAECADLNVRNVGARCLSHRQVHDNDIIAKRLVSENGITVSDAVLHADIIGWHNLEYRITKKREDATAFKRDNKKKAEKMAEARKLVLKGYGFGSEYPFGP